LKEAPGRNEPCFCGSGRKYKDCHLKPFYPNEYFSCKISGFDTIKFENRLPNNYFEVGLVDVNYGSPLPWDNEISKLLKIFTSVDLIENNRWENRVKHRLSKIHHKLHAVRYHIESFKNFESNTISEFKNYIIASTTMNKIYDDPLLIYNLESFLFQSKSFLDVFSQLIAVSFRSESTTYANFGDDLIKIFQKKLNNEKSEEIRRVMNVIKAARVWVKELVGMRDEVTHFSDLEGLSCFFIMQSKESDEQVRVYYPSLPSGERVTTYMDTIWNNICRLISDTAQPAVDYLRTKSQEENKVR
jgi:hypothetical protein